MACRDFPASERMGLLEVARRGVGRRRPMGGKATTTHVLRDLAAIEERPCLGLTALEAIELSAGERETRQATSTHALHDISALFTDEGARGDGRERRVRVCVVDTLLQTGGAEWFAAQLALAANPHVFEFIFVTFNSQESVIAKQLMAHGIRVLSAYQWRRGSFQYSEWLDEDLFELLGRLSPDLLFFSSQYLFEQLPQDRLEHFTSVVRISNFHADALATANFNSVSKIVCCSDEQYSLVSHTRPDKAVLIRTGVDIHLFRDPGEAERQKLKEELGWGNKQVVLFVGRLGSPLKRLEVFQDVVLLVKEQRADVIFVVVGYFSAHDRADEDAFRRFAEGEGVVWKDQVPPWEIPVLFQVADFLLSTSAEYEGLSNTVLQALASGAVPVTTASAGMRELIERDDTGYLVSGFGSEQIANTLSAALDSTGPARERLREHGRRKVETRFSFEECAADYQRHFMECHRRAPVSVAITDGSFGTGGAEWLASLLMLNSAPEEVRFRLMLQRPGSQLAGWLTDRGFRVHSAPPGMSYDSWRGQGLAETFRATRPDVVMPCTVVSWPRHDPFYRLMMISQNVADASRLTTEQYETADHILCVSQEVMQNLDPRFQGKMTVLRNSIDVDMFSPRPRARKEIREQLGIAGDTRVVLWCGRMHQPFKRLDVLTGVIDETREESLHYLVVGYFRENEQEGLAAWRSFLAAHGNVSWVGGAPPWEMPRYYSAADVYLSTSGFGHADFEGLSLTSVQALAAELPIVTTMSGGQREVVEEGLNGKLFAQGDVAGLAAGVRDLASLDPSALKDMRARNRRKALASFDIRKHAQLYSRIARMLKGNVGPAMTVDPDLPAPGYAFVDADTASSASQRRAASFLRYCWPMLGSFDEVEGGPACSIYTHEDLRRVAATVPSGGRLTLSKVGPDLDLPAAPPASYSAARIAALVEYLRSSFPAWGTVRRSGRDLVMEKR